MFSEANVGVTAPHGQGQGFPRRAETPVAGRLAREAWCLWGPHAAVSAVGVACPPRWPLSLHPDCAAISNDTAFLRCSACPTLPPSLFSLPKS